MTTKTNHVYSPSEIDEQLAEAKRLVILDAPYAQSGGKRYQSRRALVEIVEQQREEIALLQNAVKLHAPGWKLKCNSKDIDPATYANLIDCDVCYNVHLKPKCEEPA